ncbi:MAG: phospholipase/carboxylesterase [Myxococcota bacterium]|jgi:phospholipase/carboxylesterase
MLAFLLSFACSQLATAPPPPVPQTEIGLSALELHTGPSTVSPEVVVVAMHGLGDRPEGFVRLFETFSTPARVLLPAGPHPYSDGYSWFTAGRDDEAAFAADLAEQADAIAAQLVGRPVVTGFSQGGMLAFAIAVRHPDRISAAYPVGGALPASLIPDRRRLGGSPRIVALHGEDDTRVDYAATAAMIPALSAAGFDATLRSYPGVGHTISTQMRADLDELLAGK